VSDYEDMEELELHAPTAAKIMDHLGLDEGTEMGRARRGDGERRVIEEAGNLEKYEDEREKEEEEKGKKEEYQVRMRKIRKERNGRIRERKREMVRKVVDGRMTQEEMVRATVKKSVRAEEKNKEREVKRKEKHIRKKGRWVAKKRARKNAARESRNGDDMGGREAPQGPVKQVEGEGSGLGESAAAEGTL
jgi:hypothetical protein